MGVGFKQVFCYLWYKMCLYMLDVQSLTCPFTLKQVFVMFFDMLMELHSHMNDLFLVQ